LFSHAASELRKRLPVLPPQPTSTPSAARQYFLSSPSVLPQKPVGVPTKAGQNKKNISVILNHLQEEEAKRNK
jgi:hypothetical protein